MTETIKPREHIATNDILPVQGFKAIGVPCGLRRSGKPDFTMIVSDVPCRSAGVFTMNRVKAAPILVSMENLDSHGEQMRGVVINAANANACTGQQGLDNAWQTAEWAAQALGCSKNEIVIMSTGVIGVQLPIEKLQYGVETATPQLDVDGWATAARGIMTTDTRPKASSRVGDGYTISGIAKGSGMIAPNMATMLSVIATDADIDQATLQKALSEANNQSFNRICVDGDTSTNDCVVLLANGESGTKIETDSDYQAFVALLMDLSIELGQMIVRDGEGATKFITIEVTNAPDKESAYQIANTIATSPLVKTAFYGSDANWGRIFAAAGRAGVEFDANQVDLWFSEGLDDQNGLRVVENGTPTNYSEADATHIFEQLEIYVKLDLKAGNATEFVWTCDLSHDYVTINGDYRT